MINPKVAEKAIEEFVKKFGAIGVKNLRTKTGFKKAIINSILHENRNYVKVEQSPLSSRNKKVIWKWSDSKVPLPSKKRVMSAVVSQEENTCKVQDGSQDS
jgi:TfoX/Sxy family transcriptional regulator of competence genes